MVHQKTDYFREPIEPAVAAMQTDVLSAAYVLAKSKGERDAIAVMQTVPDTMFAALRAHMSARPNLFLAEVHSAVARIMDKPRISEAESLFA
jgi:hypothetical protein